MLNYNKINDILNKDEVTSDYLNDIYNVAIDSYKELSRISVILINGSQASNYFVRDRLTNNMDNDFYVQTVNISNSIHKISHTRTARVVDNLTELTKNDRTLYLISKGHKSSFTYPLTLQGKTIAIVFFNASENNFFSSEAIQQDMLFLSSTIQYLMARQFELKQFLNISLSIALDMGHAKDPETRGHLKRMERYSSKLAYLLCENEEVTHEFIRCIESYAAFHDIGKYKIPDDILFSTSVFNHKQREIMNHHCNYGIEIIDNALNYFPADMNKNDDFICLKNIVLHHHERFDGKGYPNGLKGEEIPLEARIIMVSDVFDALLSKRLYKKAWDLDQVIAFFKENSGTMFDPNCVNALVDNLPEFTEIYKRYSDADYAERKLITENYN